MEPMDRRFFLTAAAVIGAGLASGAAAAQSGADARDLTRISNYLNGITTLEGKFVQVGPNGDLSEGRFYMRRPGRLRFEYRPPNPALVIADGTWVGVYDLQLETLDRIPLGQTPLSLLLQERVNLKTAGAVDSVERSAGQIRVRAIDPDAPEQGSITMIFSDNPLELRQWVVVDNQGLTTTVALSETRANVKLDPNLFFIEDIN